MAEEKNMKKITAIMKKYGKWILLIILVFLFLDIIEDIFANEIYIFDNTVYHMVSNTMNPIMTQAMKIITMLGSALPILIICLVSLLLFKNKNYGKYMTLNLIIIVICNQAMKYLFQRPRPEEFRLITETGYSFPSGHSMVSMAFYGFIIYLVWKNVKKPVAKWSASIVLSILILLIGISRIYLGVHYASDVIGGFCFSIAYLILFTSIVRSKVIREDKK